MSQFIILSNFIGTAPLKYSIPSVFFANEWLNTIISPGYVLSQPLAYLRPWSKTTKDFVRDISKGSELCLAMGGLCLFKKTNGFPLSYNLSFLLAFPETSSL